MSLFVCEELQDGQCAHNVTLRLVGKAIDITHSECLCVALVIQHALRTQSIILSSIAVNSHFSQFFERA